MSTTKSKLVLKKNKKGQIYHSDTNLVFKSASEKIVIGRLSGDEFISLDEEALELCEKNGFAYDESLVETESNQNENEKTNSENNDRLSDRENNDNQDNQDNQDNNVDKENKQENKQENLNCKVDNEVSTVEIHNNLSQTLSEFTFQINKLFNNEKNTYETKINDLELSLKAAKKELEDVKKKLKGVLLAMQEQL